MVDIHKSRLKCKLKNLLSDGAWSVEQIALQIKERQVFISTYLGKQNVKCQ